MAERSKRTTVAGGNIKKISNSCKKRFGWNQIASSTSRIIFFSVQEFKIKNASYPLARAMKFLEVLNGNLVRVTLYWWTITSKVKFWFNNIWSVNLFLLFPLFFLVVMVCCLNPIFSHSAKKCGNHSNLGHSITRQRNPRLLGWYAEFLLKIILQFLLGKITPRLIYRIMLKSLHIGPGARNSMELCNWFDRLDFMLLLFPFIVRL